LKLKLEPPAFAHHPLIRNPDGSKLSKATNATAVASLLGAGRTPDELFGEAAFLVGLIDRPRPIATREFADLLRGSD